MPGRASPGNCMADTGKDGQGGRHAGLIEHTRKGLGAGKSCHAIVRIPRRRGIARMVIRTTGANEERGRVEGSGVEGCIRVRCYHRKRQGDTTYRLLDASGNQRSAVGRGAGRGGTSSTIRRKRGCGCGRPTSRLRIGV